MMMGFIKNRIFIWALVLLGSTVAAQNTTRHNLVYAELLGHGFVDPNSSAEAGLVSINYSRKVNLGINYFRFSIGLGPVKSAAYDKISNTSHRVINVQMPFMIQWRLNDKRNGLWLGAAYTSMYGPVFYNTFIPGHLVQPFNYSYCVTPSLSYIFQAENDPLFLQISYCPKILGYAFSEYRGYENKFYPFWGGISIGGAW